MIEQIDSELERLQSHITVHSLPSESVEDASHSSVYNTASIVVDTVAAPALSGGELTEYMLRIRNRRNLALKADSIDQNEPTRQNIRENWSIDDGVGGNQSGLASFSFSAGNNRGMQNHSQQENSINEKHGANNAGRQFKETSFKDRSRNAAPRSPSHRGATAPSISVIEDREDGEDGEENENSIDLGNQNGHPRTNYSSKYSFQRQGDISAVSDALDDDNAPLEVEVDEGEVDEEEDEAELLLAALGGR